MTMVVATCRLELSLAENHSLKGKRQVLRSVSARLRSTFNLAVAEIEEQDNWHTVVLGLACVSNASLHAREVIEKAIRFVETQRLDAEVVEQQIELIHLFET
jgi:uncharacterized protein YlxP (DUF503 family)